MRKLWVLAGVVVVVVALGASPAAAGGWAVPAFDPVPPIGADEPVDIGLRVLQHGVHPVDIDGVQLLYTGADGTVTRFPAVRSGETGHYVARVTLPAGTYTWAVEAGFFGVRELGPVTVPATGVASIATPDTRDEGAAVSTTRRVARVALPVGALAAIAVGSLALRGPRRSDPVGIAAP